MGSSTHEFWVGRLVHTMQVYGSEFDESNPIPEIRSKEERP